MSGERIENNEEIFAVNLGKEADEKWRESICISECEKKQ